MKLPKGLSYRRSIEASLGFFFETNEAGEKKPVILERKTLVGPFSDIASASGSNQKNTNALNIFRTDLATLAGDTKEFSIECSITILQNWRRPYRCENKEVSGSLSGFMEAYCEADGLKTISEGYSENILNLIWCWRNSEVFQEGRQCILEFNDNSYTYLLPDQTITPNFSEIKKVNSAESIDALTTFVNQALTEPSRKNKIKLKAVFQTEPGTQVYPSQEFRDEKGSNDKAGKVRELSCSWTPDGKRQAIFHSTKIANAIHRIDRWYENSFDAPAINVNPLGFDQLENTPYRSWKSGLDIYHLLTEIEQITEDLIETKTASPHSHFLAANLLRGGLFTAKKDTESTK